MYITVEFLFCRKETIQIVFRGSYRFCLFSNFTFPCHDFHLKRVENNSICFLNWRTEKNLVENNKLKQFDVLKTGIFAQEAKRRGQISVLIKNIKFPRSNYQCPEWSARPPKIPG